MGGTKEADNPLQFVNYRELSSPDPGKEILLKRNFYEALMNCNTILGYNFLMETDCSLLLAQASVTLCRYDLLS